MLVQKIFSYTFLFILVSGLVFFWRSVDLPCEQPIPYAIGTFDSRFNIGKEDLLNAISTSEKTWEDVLGKELFTYREDASFKIHLIFDERQLQTIEAKELNQALDETQNSQASLTQKQNEMLLAYKKVAKEYESMLFSFRKQLASYNAEVLKWNKRGGAPQEEYENLQEEATELTKKQKELEEKRQKVNSLAAAVNSFSEQKVSLVDEYNEKVEAFVSRYGESKAFDQGVYNGTEINIYQFDDRPHLEAVLVHELGHALGLLHGSNPLSMMYPLMEKQKIDPVTLSSEDRDMLVRQCSQTVWDGIYERTVGLKR